MTTSPTYALRAAIITRLLADGQVAALVGTRIHEVAPPGLSFPFLLIRTRQSNDDTHSERGAMIELKVHVEGEKEGAKQGEQIFAAVKDSLRGFAPASLSGNALANLVFIDEAVLMAEDGKRYAGLQVWRAVTEEQ